MLRENQARSGHSGGGSAVSHGGAFFAQHYNAGGGTGIGRLVLLDSVIHGATSGDDTAAVETDYVTARELGRMDLTGIAATQTWWQDNAHSIQTTIMISLLT